MEILRQVEDNNIIYHQKVFTSEHGTNEIYEANFHGEPCYAIVHMPTGHTELIDHNESIVKAVVNRINRSASMVCNKNANRSFLKFKSSKTERSITLRNYVYARYRGLRLGQVRGKNICTYDDSAVKDNILDLRSCNLFDAGEIRSHTRARDITIESRPESEEKYIAITFPNRENRKIEYTDYSPQLYEMLARPAYCEIGYSSSSDRATITVHYANRRDGYISDTLARFILIYKLEFDKYKNMSGGVKRFIHDYKKLSREKYKGKVAAHINACKWNNCFNNLLFMDVAEGNNPNREMSDYIKYFSSPYGANAITNDMGEILIEFTGIGVLHNGEPSTSYYKCAIPEDYADWQKVFLGKELTGKLQQIRYATEDGIMEQLTPCGMYNSKITDRETAKNNELDLWTWADCRDKLLSMGDSAFVPYKKRKDKTIDNTVNAIIAYLHGVTGGAGV